MRRLLSLCGVFCACVSLLWRENKGPDSELSMPHKKENLQICSFARRLPASDFCSFTFQIRSHTSNVQPALILLSGDRGPRHPSSQRRFGLQACEVTPSMRGDTPAKSHKHNWNIQKRICKQYTHLVTGGGGGEAVSSRGTSAEIGYPFSHSISGSP